MEAQWADPSRRRIVPVADPDDDRLAAYKDLKDAATRRRQRRAGEVVVEGKVAVRHLLRTPLELCSLLVDDHQFEAAAWLVEAFAERQVPVYVAPRPVVAATVGFRLHRGIVAVARRPSDADPADLLAAAVGAPSAGGGRPLLAVLEGLNDHENIGSLFRNAAAFGVGAVLADPTCADPLSRRSVRVSSGHALSIPFARLAPWPAALAQVRAAGFAVVALSPGRSGKGQGPVPEPLDRLAARPGPVAVLLGAEGPGLSSSALAAADVVATIPMAPSVDSLNVATAAAVAFHRLSGRACAGAERPGPGD